MTDAADAALIEQAEYFIASIFIGRGEFDKVERPTLATARDLADAMAAHYRNGRKGMVYAVLPDGRSVFVPNSYQPKETTVTKTFSKKFNAQRAAKKSGLDPNEVREVSPGQWVLPARSDEAAAEGEALTAEATTGNFKREGAEAPAEKPARKPRVLGKRKAAEEAAANGTLPTPPDFSADTHKPHRKKLEQLVALVEEGDVDALKAFHINPTSTSPKALDRYRNLAVTALEARQGEKRAA